LPTGLPLTRRLPSIPSAAVRTALFEDFLGTTHLSDFSGSCFIGYGSSPSRCGPDGARPAGRTGDLPGSDAILCSRDVVFDPGRASAPRIAVPHMLPSTLLTVSASASFEISWLNSTPHCIAVYASQSPSPTTTQHSLAGARYGLPAPVFHRLDRASFPGAQAISMGGGQPGRDGVVAPLLAMTPMFA